MSDWKPGDVVTATVRGRENVRLVAGWSKYEPRLRWCEMSPRWADGDDDDCWFMPRDVTDARLLVVIDPENEGDLDRLQDALITGGRHIGQGALQAALREFAAPKPPKPEEPMGLGAVVEDEDGESWVRFKSVTGWWWRDLLGKNSRYADLAAVRVLSEGVQP